MALVTAWRIYAARNGLATAGALYIRSDFRFDAPLVGCALALIERVKPAWIAAVNSTPLRSDLMAMLAVACLCAWIGLRLNDAAYPGTEGSGTDLLGLLLVLSQIGVPGRVSAAFTWKPLVRLGEISYGVYLWQELFLGPRTPFFYVIRTFPIGLFATLLVAVASFKYLEKPLLQLKDRKFHKREMAVAAAEPRR